MSHKENWLEKQFDFDFHAAYDKHHLTRIAELKELRQVGKRIA